MNFTCKEDPSWDIGSPNEDNAAPLSTEDKLKFETKFLLFNEMGTIITLLQRLFNFIFLPNISTLNI